MNKSNMRNLTDEELLSLLEPLITDNPYAVELAERLKARLDTNDMLNDIKEAHEDQLDSIHLGLQRLGEHVFKLKQEVKDIETMLET